MANASNQKPNEIATGVEELESTTAFIQGPLTQALASLSHAEPDLPNHVSEDQYRRLFESSTDGALLVDASAHTILAVNAAALDLLGKSQEELLSQDLWQVGLFPDLAVAQQVWRELEETGVARVDIVALQPATGGTTRYADMVSNRFHIDDRDVIRFHLRDVTERFRLEQAQRELEARKDAFISMASHELRTPITSLKAFTQILQNRARRQQPVADPQTLQVLGRMDAQIDRLAHLVTDLLDLSKMQAGSLAFRDTRFDLDALVHETVETMQAVTTTHQLSVEGSTSAEVSGDRDRLGQVLINLLSNALKYSPAADRIIVYLRIDTTQAESGEQNWADISVRDFGIGIAAEHQQRVFERFYQVGDSENGAAYPGLGIGLHIARTIVERHGGRLWMESLPGDGSTFHISLPLTNEGEELPSDDPRRSANHSPPSV